jgi:hypothetical protein
MSFYRATPKIRKSTRKPGSLEEFEEEINLIESFFRVTEPISSEKPVFSKSLCHKCHKIVLLDTTNNTVQYFPDPTVCNCKRIGNRIVR